MPALPLDDAGPYVAAAYLVFLALILVYVAIMAGRLARMERDVADLERIVRQRAENGSPSAEPGSREEARAS